MTSCMFITTYNDAFYVFCITYDVM